MPRKTAPVAIECIIPILSVKDLAVSVRFYVDVLGFALEPAERA
jgi:hypothetical protein